MKRNFSIGKGCFSPIKKAIFFPKLSPIQKAFGQPKRDNYRDKFRKAKIADTGSDPQGCFIKFNEREIIKSPSRVSYLKNVDYSDIINMNKTNRDNRKHLNLLSLNNTTASLEAIDAKLNFGKSNVMSSPLLANEKTPLSLNEGNNRLSLVEIKKRHGSNIESKEYWSPDKNNKTEGRNNRNSVEYNIITHENRTLTGPKSLLIHMKHNYNLRKGVCEINDLDKPFFLKHNQEFSREYYNNDTPKQFYGVKGIFTHMYDYCIKNGLTPFKRMNSTSSLIPDHSKLKN